MDYSEYFKGKKITIMGLGLLGRGVGDAEFLAEQGAKLTVTDLKTEKELKASIEKLKKYDISYTLGKHDKKDFKNCDMVLKAAGVPLDSTFIKEAVKNRIPVEMSASLFVKLSPATIIGVTGTRGKSTIAAMIYEILKTASKKTFLGGNIKGVSTLAHLKESTTDEIAVLELDSWQLQGFGEARISPHIAVFATFYPDHLNYYKGNMGAYFKDKSYIFKYQTKNDFLILGNQCADLIRKKYPKIKSKIVISNLYDISFKLKLLGEHNKYNAALATESARALEIDEKAIKRGLKNFSGLQGRLEFVKEIKGVKIYNDNSSTTPEATLAALSALWALSPKQYKTKFKKEKKTILIMGGSDKGLDFTKLLEAISRFCKSVILLPGTGTNKLVTSYQPAPKLRQAGKLQVTSLTASNLKEAMEKAMEMSEKGDVILFSPAFASFGPPPGGFKNEFERGDKFVKIVRNL